MNEDKNKVDLADAPKTVDGQEVLKVQNVYIGETESSYKVITADGNVVSVSTKQFIAGADVVTNEADEPQHTPAPPDPNSALTAASNEITAAAPTEQPPVVLSTPPTAPVEQPAQPQQPQSQTKQPQGVVLS